MRGRVAARRIACVGVLLLGGCAQVTRSPVTNAPQQTPTPVAQPSYAIMQGRDAALVARLRAAAPLVQPVLRDGAMPAGDERMQRAQGLVRIGIGHYPSRDATEVHAQVLAQARKVGADLALIYPPVDADVAGTASYFVRLQLPFGANFRDLTEVERQEFGNGVEIGEVVGRTPASEANLREGDYVLKFNRKPLRDKAAFQALLQNHLGRRVTLIIRRDGVTMNRLVVLGTLPAESGH